ncbi:magnesium transporter [Anoxybacillus voinovskiensis]|uniref:Magnesium transporter n=1 Tax=Anoxybacteroides voinovskiense TaxID=230470 RepID=A0A840DR01_9BACL|nr:magnesium transporter CorA family protein [Anoxybacillus voinovskiensis]MBB4073952.1 magnesium transporter [Anoxybacillus voinovskiensis]GGJ65893.1 magnesium transporter [Anoxybacillus voinovskiensis]
MMKMYLSNANGKIEEIHELKNGCWINLIAPTEEEIRYIANHLDIPIDSIKDALDDEERSRIEKEDNHVLIIVDIPIITQDEVDGPIYETIPIGMIITNTCFITVCLQENPIFQEFANNKIKNFYTFMKTRFALQMLYMISTYYLRYLKQINRRTSEIEKRLHQSMKNEELFSLLSMEKSLVYFTTSLKANNIVMERLMRLNYLRMYDDDQELLEDVIIENKQAIEMTEVYSSILSGMMDAFASVISNNLNIVMKFLTAVTIVLSLPTMVASFYGMNVPIPYQNSPHAFLTALLLSALLSSATAFLFWKKRYF